MGTSKEIKLNIHKFYTYSSLDHILFGYVMGVTEALPSVSVNKAVSMWLDRFNLCEDVLCMEAARATYYRILKSLKEKETGMAEYPEIDEDFLPNR